MIKRITILLLAGSCLTCLTSCSLLGNLLQTVIRLPTTVLGSISEAETESENTGEPVPGQPQENAPDAVSIAVTPVE